MNVTTSTTHTQRKTIRISREDIIRFLQSEGHVKDEDDVKEVYVKVPGGGDWSNTNLDIEHDDEVVVEVVETSTSS